MTVVKSAEKSTRCKSKGGKVVDVDITAIRTTAEIESRTINGYKRAGYDIGMKAATANCLPGKCDVPKGFARTGYDRATEYLEALG